MQEVASNIESRASFADVKRMVEAKIDRADLQFMLQQKVSYDEMKNYVEQVNQFRFNPQQEQFDNEIRRINKLLDEKVAHMNLQIQPLLNIKHQPSPPSPDLG